MHRCRCTTQALEIFFNDLTGFSLRQQRVEHLRLSSRRFSTRPCLRLAQVLASPGSDDGYIPFELGTENIPQTIPIKQSSPRKARIKLQKSDQQLDGNEWHAEVEIVSLPDAQSESRGTETAREENGRVLKRCGRWPEGAHTTVDSVTLQIPSEQATPHIRTAEMPLLPLEPKLSAQRSKSDSRIERKRRRMLAGTYKPTAEARGEHESADTQIQTVLRKLDKLEGPKLPRVMAAAASKSKAVTKRDGDKSKTSYLATVASREADGTRSSAAAAPSTERLRRSSPKEIWQIQKKALEAKFGEAGWQPRKKLSPDTLEGIRALHASDPAAYSTETLSEHFKITPEAVRRILKSKWRPNDEEAEDRRNRWERRGVKKWQDMAEQGMRPPAKWRAMGVGSEDGVKEDRVPKRRKKRQPDHLSWDEVVGGMAPLTEGTSLAERIL